MSTYPNKSIIPNDWFDNIDKTRFFEEISLASRELNAGLEEYFGYKPGSQDEVIYILADKWNKTFEVVFNILKSIIRFRAITSIFENDFSNNFPCDDNDRLLLTPDVINVIFKHSPADELNVIRENKTELIDSKLLQKWLGLNFEFVN